MNNDDDQQQKQIAANKAETLRRRKKWEKYKERKKQQKEEQQQQATANDNNQNGAAATSSAHNVTTHNNTPNTNKTKNNSTNNQNRNRNNQQNNNKKSNNNSNNKNNSSFFTIPLLQKRIIPFAANSLKTLFTLPLVNATFRESFTSYHALEHVEAAWSRLQKANEKKKTDKKISNKLKLQLFPLDNLVETLCCSNKKLKVSNAFAPWVLPKLLNNSEDFAKSYFYGDADCAPNNWYNKFYKMIQANQIAPIRIVMEFAFGGSDDNNNDDDDSNNNTSASSSATTRRSKIMMRDWIISCLCDRNSSRAMLLHTSSEEVALAIYKPVWKFISSLMITDKNEKEINNLKQNFFSSTILKNGRGSNFTLLYIAAERKFLNLAKFLTEEIVLKEFKLFSMREILLNGKDPSGFAFLLLTAAKQRQENPPSRVHKFAVLEYFLEIARRHSFLHKALSVRTGYNETFMAMIGPAGRLNDKPTSEFDSTFATRVLLKFYETEYQLLKHQLQAVIRSSTMLVEAALDGNHPALDLILDFIAKKDMPFFKQLFLDVNSCPGEGTLFHAVVKQREEARNHKQIIGVLINHAKKQGILKEALSVGYSSKIAPSRYRDWTPVAFTVLTGDYDSLNQFLECYETEKEREENVYKKLFNYDPLSIDGRLANRNNNNKQQLNLRELAAKISVLPNTKSTPVLCRDEDFKKYDEILASKM